MKMFRILKILLVRALQMIGYTIIPNWQINSYQQGSLTRRLLSLLSIDCVIDIGANKGQYYDFLRNEGNYSGQVISFEPIPDLAADLSHRSDREPNWIVRNAAVGSVTGVKEFHVANFSVFSSFLAPLDDNISAFGGANKIHHTIPVPMETLENIISSLRKQGFQNIFVKIDTQGYELEVLRGASEQLRYVRGLQTELAFRRSYDGMPLYDEVLNYLRDFGFAVSGIFPVNSSDFPQLLEVDCFLINAASESAS